MMGRRSQTRAVLMAVAIAPYLLLIPYIAAASGQKKDEIQIIEQEVWTQISTNPPGEIFSVTLKAIPPDGSHALLYCDSTNSRCGGIQSFAPEKMPLDSKKCKDSTAKDLVWRTCTTINLGTFRFKRSVNAITIYSASGNSQLDVTGPW